MIVDIQHLKKAYPQDGAGTGEPVLRKLDLQVAAGASLAITGPSGCGKSTLLNIIGALDHADSGRVEVAGRDLGAMDARELAAFRNTAVGFVFQLHHLLPQCSVLENVLVPTLARTGAAPEGARERAEALLESVGLAGRMGHRPGQLSGGERQRAALARALINRPQLLLADEPTGALDRKNADRLADLLLELNRGAGVTLILVTHAPELAARMGRVLELVDGKLVERTP